jgi:ParB-like nuclease domain
MYRRYDFSNLNENEIRRLKPHPLNDRIYGASAPDKELQKSIEDNGVFNPIIINRNKEILSGTRRWLAAKKVGFKKVPVITLLSKGAEGLLGEQFLIESNRARVKTEGEKVREVAELLRIESELAKQRQLLGTKDLGPTSGQGSERKTKGSAAELVAKKVGWGEPKVREAVAVAASKTALAAVDAGKSVHEAYKKLKNTRSPQKESEGVLLAKELTKLFRNGEVSRSRTDSKFHVILRDLNEKEVRNLAKDLCT